MLRIVFFDFVDAYGGMPRLTLSLARALRHDATFTFVDPVGCCDEYRQDVLASGFAYEVLDPGHGVMNLGPEGRSRRAMALVRQSARFLKVVRRLRGAIERHQPQVIWTSTHKGTLLALRALGRRKLPVAFHFRCTWTRHMARGWRWKVVADERVTLLTESATNRQRLIEAGIAPGRVHVVPNAIDADEARRRGESATGGPDAPLPQADRPVRVLLSGTLEPRKGHLTAVRALARIVHEGLDAVLYIPGDNASPLFADHVRDIQSLAASLNIADRVAFLGWRRDMPRVMRHATVVCLPSMDEGLPLALMEAMAVERPVISTPVGGIPDLVVDGKTGWLCPVGDDAALAAALRRAGDPAQRDPVVAAALRHVREQFSHDLQRRLALEVFRRLAGDTAKRRETGARGG